MPIHTILGGDRGNFPLPSLSLPQNPLRDITTGMVNTGNINNSGNSRGGLGFEAQLWAAADKMRRHMDASGHKLRHFPAPTARSNNSPGQRLGNPETPFNQALKGRPSPCPNPSCDCTSILFSARNTAPACCRRLSGHRFTPAWPRCCKFRLSDMFGTRPPFQGLGLFQGVIPRALPWAGLFRPFGADESRTLAALHDALLPKLSGELRLPAAAKLVEANA
jgi:hypothetical protein